ncbi:MAG: glycosyltransferase family 2 protein [Bradyrhizobium sp.]|uniref:glycosyltransferase family 2 protein n=1 Tax=Bradyrhizobium sp. TaxID=376 RepID=UPI001C293892|nr:glycosyltransferase family 2 protein [Bradyrhizobium sp.]MBU6461133.1 glycosyltransferase family 2 protein [Pseudomonadota bacterium]MDE2066210.1 glycosyltransferase family 2 protein [Bradyrhizobium sp.]MDE2472650.1 glycosyltransferase family 2 protein [Bradyrhizobium sp.]
MRFSIVIPCFDRRADLRTAIKSCLTQTFTDFELIVVDDASKEPLEDICNEFGDDRIKYHRNAVNLGVSHCRNTGIEHAVGQYISFLDSDDLYLPNRLEVIDHYLSDIANLQRIIFHRQHRLLAPNEAGPIAPARLPLDNERLDNFILIGGNFIQTNSFLVERELAKAIKFDVLCKRHEDTKFIIECWLASPSYIACNETLSIYHDFRLSSRLSKQNGFELLEPLLLLTAQRCSREAHAGFAAYASSEISFFQKPLYVLAAIWQAYRLGVTVPRCAVYLSRSVFGTTTVDGIIHKARILSLRFRHAFEERELQPQIRP